MSTMRARGGVDVLYFSQIVKNGDPKSEGGVNELLESYRLTSMPRPQEIQVGCSYFRREIVHVHAREPGQARKRATRPGILDALGKRGGGDWCTSSLSYERPPRTCPTSRLSSNFENSA